MKLTPDFIFSYWVFTWYILYMFKMVSYNPLFAIVLGIIENIGLLLYISLNGASISTILKLAIVIIFIEIIPYYTLNNDKIIKRDIFATMFFFIIYLLWLLVNNMNILNIYNEINQSLIHNKGTTPGIMIINNILAFLHGFSRGFFDVFANGYFREIFTTSNKT
jgi:hypothetical protein